MSDATISVVALITRLQALADANPFLAHATVALYDWQEQYANPSEEAAAAPLEVWGDENVGFSVILGVPQGEDNLARGLIKEIEALGKETP